MGGRGVAKRCGGIRRRGALQLAIVAGICAGVASRRCVAYTGGNFKPMQPLGTAEERTEEGSFTGRLHGARNGAMASPNPGGRKTRTPMADSFSEAGIDNWVDQFSFVIDVLKVVFGAGCLVLGFALMSSDESSANGQAGSTAGEPKDNAADYVAPRSTPWTAAELARYAGEEDPNGPLLMGVDGVVLNVSKARHLYGPGCAYHIFVGKDASRLLGRNLLEEEPAEEALKPLTIAENAQLQTWAWTLKAKYKAVGTLATTEKKEDEVELSEAGREAVPAIAKRGMAMTV